MVTKLIVIILSVIVFTLGFKIDSSEYEDTANSIPSKDDIQAYRNLLSKFNVLSSLTNAVDKVEEISRKDNEGVNSEIFEIPGYIQTTEKISEEKYDHTTNIEDIYITDSSTIQKFGKEFTTENAIVIQDKEIAIQSATQNNDLYTIKTKLDTMDKTLNKKIDDIAAQINKEEKLLNNLEEKFSAQVNALKDLIYPKQLNEFSTTETNDFDTPSELLTTTSDSREGNLTDMKSTTDSNFDSFVMRTATTNKPNESFENETSELKIEKSRDLVITAVNKDSSDTHDWSDICLDPAEDTDGIVPRNWGPGDYPDSDKYDNRLRQKTGCKSRMVPPYDRQPFHWDWPKDEFTTDYVYDYVDMPTKTNRGLEYRLAVRTIGKGRADIKIYWNGERKYYFAFSNTSNVVEFNRYSPYEQLWVGKFDDPLWNAEFEGDIVKREHYMPVQFTLHEDKLTFRVGCSPPINLEEYQSSIPTKKTDRITLEIETSAYPAKLLYDCPLKSRDETLNA